MQNTADTLIFHNWDFNWNDVPKTRLKWQKYVYFAAESPIYTNPLKGSSANNIDAKHFFNWTMSYRKDSDVYAPYFSVVELEEKLDEKKWQNVRFTLKFYIFFATYKICTL